MEIGKYGRTNKGKILIFVWVENANYILVKTRNEKQNNDILNFDKYYLDKDEEIIKHSKKIIDLIEVGDYVNGYRVVSVDYDVIDDKTECIELDLNNNYQYNFISARQIKTIITKEQMASIEYKVEEDK